MASAGDGGPTHAYVALEQLDAPTVRAYVGIGTNHSRAFEPNNSNGATTSGVIPSGSRI